MSRFTECLDHILQWEGGYANHPHDKGGETAKGITQATYNDYNVDKGRTLESVRDITEAEVKEIYLSRYWNACRCEDLHPPLDFIVFDSAIQHGVSRAARWLQKLGGVMADGKIGNETLFAVNQAILDHRLDALIDDYLAMRDAYYAQIIAGNPTQKVFEKGWKSRLNKLREAVK